MGRRMSMVLAPAVALAAAGALAAQDEPGRLLNASVQRHQVAGSLRVAFNALVAPQQAPAWIGYSVPAVPGHHRSCDAVVQLESKGDVNTRRRASLDGPSDLLVLFRVAQGRVEKVRPVSADCDIDAGGLPLHWLSGVKPAESAAMLSTMAAAPADRAGQARIRGALAAVALHRDAAALEALRRLVSAGSGGELRKQAAFWLGVARGREGFETLQGLLGDPDPGFRHDLAFAVFVSKEPEAAGLLVRLAREDESPKVRAQALFWLGQKAGAASAGTIENAIQNDPDTEVKKRAVFALSQLPKDEGVPRLMQVARSNRNPVVRRQAMFWLGQSGDPRALAFFEEILKK